MVVILIMCFARKNADDPTAEVKTANDLIAVAFVLPCNHSAQLTAINLELHMFSSLS